MRPAAVSYEPDRCCTSWSLDQQLGVAQFHLWPSPMTASPCRWLRRISLLLCLILAASPPALAAGQTAVPCDTPGISRATSRIFVTVTRIRYAGGNVTITLYGADPAKFLVHHGAIALIRVPVTANAVQGCFAVAGPGTYSVAVYDDPHNHHHFDRTMLGLPGADYGFSNNPRILLAPPGFRETAFSVPAGDTHISVALHP
jgi:uncharacterized protein (DUF2141 family)